jgi:hypothetical protein
MNHHADKLDYSESGSAGPGLGGIVKEVYSCPRCGDVELQTADEGPIQSS